MARVVQYSCFMATQIKVGSVVRYAALCPAGFYWIEGVVAGVRERMGEMVATVREPHFCGKTLGFVPVRSLQARVTTPHGTTAWAP